METLIYISRTDPFASLGDFASQRTGADLGPGAAVGAIAGTDQDEFG